MFWAADDDGRGWGDKGEDEKKDNDEDDDNDEKKDNDDDDDVDDEKEDNDESSPCLGSWCQTGRKWTIGSPIITNPPETVNGNQT